MSDQAKQTFFIAVACAAAIIMLGKYNVSCNASDNEARKAFTAERSAAYRACVEKHQPAECDSVKP